MAPSNGVYGGRAATDLGVKPRGWGFHLPTCMKIQRPPRHRACPSSKGVFPDQSPRCNPTSGFRAVFLPLLLPGPLPVKAAPSTQLPVLAALLFICALGAGSRAEAGVKWLCGP